MQKYLSYLTCCLCFSLTTHANGLNNPFINHISVPEQTVIAVDNLSTPQLTTITLPIQYAKASELSQILTTGSGSFLSPQGSLSHDERTNSLIIQDTENQLNVLKKVNNTLDQSTQQILIEARMITISDESLKELGVRWGILDPVTNRLNFGANLSTQTASTLPDSLNINFPNSYDNAAIFSLQLAKINSKVLDLELSALQRENQVNIIASPRLLTTNNHSASIKQGTEIPYLVNGKDDTQSVAFREAVLGLEVTPQLLNQKQILLNLLITQNSPGNSVAYGNNNLTTIDKQEIKTQVFAQHGQTIILGGVFHDTQVQRQDSVPELGSIPLLGHLFGRNTKRSVRRELVIFVTPYLIGDKVLNHNTNTIEKSSLSYQYIF